MISNNPHWIYSELYPKRALLYGTCLLFLYVLSSCIYAVTFHPLAKIPGPHLAAASRIQRWYYLIQGTQTAWIKTLHEKYGPVVRYGPWELSYADNGQAWRDVAGYKKDKKEHMKALENFPRPSNGVAGIVTAAQADHSRMRRVLAPAFSDRGLKSQEPLFRKHVGMLVSQLSELAQQGPVNMNDMMNFTTFDIIADLTFGQPLNLLKDNKYSPWVACVLDYIKSAPLLQLIQYYPIFDYLFSMFEPESIKERRRAHWNHTLTRIDTRMNTQSDKPDIWNLVLAAEGSEKGLSRDEMDSTAEFFMMAGSETTSAEVTGLLYHLTQNPDEMQLLVNEIRGVFANEDEIGIERLASMKYLNACISEGLRIYPPVPTGAPRIASKDGAVVRGRWLSPGTHMECAHYTAQRSAANFKDPDSFVPRRWLGDPEYKNDNFEALQAFSLGPRNCIGQNMAWAEMRLILAHILYAFDVVLCPESENWPDQKVFGLWKRHPLMCRLRPAARK